MKCILWTVASLLLVPSTSLWAESRLHVPVVFIENGGQVNDQVDYYVPGKDKSLYFNSKGLTVSLPDPDRRGTGWSVKVGFLGAAAGVKPQGLDVAPTKINYFKGPRSEWKRGITTYRSLQYADLWKGIDLVYRGDAGKVEYRFVVKPGADPKKIRLSYAGAEKVAVNPAGALEIRTPGNDFTEGALRVYQEKDGVAQDVPAKFAVKRDRGRYVVGFDLGDYDSGKELIIDPEVFLYAGFIGGDGFDRGHGIAVDADGNAYVTGATTSSNSTFPVTAGAFDTTRNGGNADAYVAKVAADGASLVYATFIGDGLGRDIAIDADGNAYVTGDTQSNEANFPVTVGPDLTFNSSNSFIEDVFVAKLSADGSDLLYAGYIGGAGTDLGYAIAVDAAGSAYVVGRGASGFPATVGPDISCNGIFYCSFVAKVTADGTGLVYAGYIGGDADAYDVAVDADGSAYVTGIAGDILNTTGGPDSTYNGAADAFVAKVMPDGTAFEYCGYIGGTHDDFGYGIAVDADENVYITGVTSSTEDDVTPFPVTSGAFDETANGGRDAFVVKVAADGSSFEYGTYLGGSGEDSGDGIAIDADGNAYIAGGTHSTEADFPVVDGPDLTANGSADGFVTKLSADGTSLIYSGFIGGSGFDVGVIGDSGVDVHPICIAIDADGNAYLAGDTGSTQSNFPVAGGPDLTFNGSLDTFVVKIGDGSAPVCGNGAIEVGEQCDDGNLANGDGCSAACVNEVVPSCGDGIPQTGEACDDGNTDDTDECKNDCTLPAGGTTSGTATAGGTSGTAGATGGTAGTSGDSGDSGGCSLVR
ncbi:MAG TPA: SBBP repeat-containing protein [bacterium]|nr:SBBP repeat-containing protein [bacterium]